ncbi:hypothetical protein [Qipengyuania spongiae]|uniref:Autotransporter domain-containing protein n=1 Tax=Qipengyuania spongiae TaxID=2909673 RepID=A0ABY5T0T7_9SPHN|nr:hypothetical protein [Qipengyuania spongiae]UVI40393.1 hypothetical protein L1F33_05475 [Qipengyuania spongiae]
MSIGARTTARPGRPLFFMLATVAGWSALRVGFGSLPFALEPLPVLVAAELPGAIPAVVPGLAVPDRADSRVNATIGATGIAEALPLRALAEGLAASPLLSPLAAIVSSSAPAPDRAQSLRTAASHNLLWMAAMAQVPVPPEVARMMDGRSGAESARPQGERGRSDSVARRLSLDSWLFLRSGGEGEAKVVTGAPGPAFYGRSQAGAILRYRLATASRFDPAAYVRADAALVSRGERQVALGVSARPLAALPLVAHAEMRATRQDGRTELRPAAFVTTGTDAAPLPGGFALRSYGQAGYVGGRFASAFADGQAVATREVARFDLGSLRAGAGVWGGAQRGVQRLDIGPSAALSIRLGDAPAHLSLDYRVRVAGDAAPGSGATLTLSRSF